MKALLSAPVILTLFLWVTACATNSGPSRGADTTDTGARIVLIAENAPATVVRPPPRQGPVEVTQAEYEAAMVKFAKQLRDKLPPRPAKQVQVISWSSPGERDKEAELVHEYLQWCEQRGTPGDCWNLLRGRTYLNDEARRDLAFALATEGVWLGTAAVVDEVLDPIQLQLALMASITTTMALLAIPEPVSKFIVIGMMLTLVAYVGWDTLASLIDGWRQLNAEAKRAQTFSELREAGKRYGRLMGEKVTRLLILAATAALGSAGGTAMGGGGAQLPRLAQASRMAAAEGLPPLRVMGQVKTVKVTGRILTISMEPGALLMANQGMGPSGRNNSASNTPTPASKYRLTSIESWRKPRLTEDGRILPFKQTREPATPIKNLGRNRAGQTVTDGKTTVRFDKNGFPEFDTKFEVLLENTHIGSGKHELHFKAANKKLFDAIQADPDFAKALNLGKSQVDKLVSIPRAPDGYSWHHHQDAGRMQLITSDSHVLARPHTGGMAIWGGGY